MSASRRFHLCLPSDLEAELSRYGRPRGLGLGPTIRRLVLRGLELDQDSSTLTTGESPVALAALTAAEHVVLMVASILPEGEQRARNLAQQAVLAAEERLALFRDQVNE